MKNYLKLGNIKVLEKALFTRKKKILQITGNITSYYRIKSQHKKLSDKIRIIKEPLPELKRIQKIVNRLLCKLPVSENAHGWISKRNRLSCVKQHIKKKHKYTFDIEDFFDSIHNSVINKLFLKYKCSYYVAKLLTKLTTIDNSLPQGAPTSQTLANLVFKPIDDSITAYAKKIKAKYDRFGDDVIISSQKPLRDIQHSLITILRMHGFKLNLKKSTVAVNREIKFLGLSLFKKPSIPKKERKIISSILYNARNTGLNKQNKINHRNFRAHLKGKIANIKYIHSKSGQKMEAELKKIPD